jgi:hypothetical protein
MLCEEGRGLSQKPPYSLHCREEVFSAIGLPASITRVLGSRRFGTLVRLMDGGGPSGGRANPLPAEVRILPPPLVYPRLKPPGLSFGTVGPCNSWDSLWWPS